MSGPDRRTVNAAERKADIEMADSALNENAFTRWWEQHGRAIYAEHRYTNDRTFAQEVDAEVMEELATEE